MDSEAGVIDTFVLTLMEARRIRYFKNEPNPPCGCGSFRFYQFDVKRNKFYELLQF